jgi:hypothetical protein
MSNYQHERGWLDSAVWGNAPYSEREAFSWMIGEAAWKDSTVSVKGRPVPVKRGQFTASLRFLASKWQWNKNKVDRYLKTLEIWQMIEIETDIGTGQNVVTICNYNKYQEKNGKTGTANGTEAGQPRDKLETLQAHQSNSYTALARAHEAGPNQNFRTVYDAGSATFPTLATRHTAAINQWLEAGADPVQDILPLFERFRDKRIQSWGYFTGAVMDAISARLNPPTAASRSKTKKPSHTDEHREAMARALQNSGGAE